MHVDLLNGQSAELRDAETFTRGERREFYKKIGEANDSDDKDNPVGLASLAIFAGLVESWTLDVPLPTDDVAVLDDLLAIDFSTIDYACAEVMKKLSPAQNFAESVDPQSPTKPSSE